jgi:hypothetical protein
MNLLLFKFVIVAQTLLMALPPGWCCTSALRADVPRDDRQQESTPATTPCGCPIAAQAIAQPKPLALPAALHPASHHPATSQPAPTSSTVHCCCTRDVTVNSQAKLVDDSSAVSLLPAAITSDPTHDLVADISRELEFPPGPSLMVLHCVWRC